MPPPPPLVSDVPNVSATYIPGGESFGPGVGIPPLYTQQEQEPALARDDSFSYSHFEAGLLQDQKFFNGSSSAISPGKELPSFSEHVSGSVPQTPYGKMNHNPLSAIPQSAVQPNGQTRQYYVEAPDNQITHGRSSSAGLLSPSDPARDWPLERVLKWLEVNGFSTEWQETFGSLNIHGKDFLDLGGANNVRGTIGMMHEKVYPRLARVCAMSTGWNQDRETREGRRLKKEVRKIAENTDSKSHGRRESANMAPSASTDGGVESSPNPSTNDALSVTPSTAGGGDDSPGRHFRSPVPGINSRMGSKTRSSTAPTAVYNHGHASASESLLADANQGNRAGVTRGILNNINDAMSKRHHSPSASSETGTGSTFIGDALRNAYDASPQSGSPSSQHAMLPPSSGPGALSAPPHGRAAHRKTGSTDSVASRRNGQEAHRPTILDIAGRHHSHDTPSSAKELSKGFLERFRKRRKDQDSNHVSPEDHHPDSPTSPQHHRIMPPSLPFTKGQMNNSSTSLDRPSSASTEHDRFLRERGIFRDRSSRKFAFVTPDQWNYRLVDITDADNASTVRDVICKSLNYADHEVDMAQLFLTEPGQFEYDDPLSDPMLMLTKHSKADSFGTLKIYVRRGPNSASLGVSGLGIGMSPKASPPAGSLFPRKALDEESYQRLRTNNTRQHTSRPSEILIRDIPAATGDGSSNPLSPEPLSAKSQIPIMRAARQSGSLSNAQWRAWLEAEIEEYRLELEKHPDENNDTDGTADAPATTRVNPALDGGDRRISMEAKKPEPLMPTRKPPAPPAAGSQMLEKANSLTRKAGESVRSSVISQTGSLHRMSIPVEAATPPGSNGIGAAVVNAGDVGSSVGKLVGSRRNMSGLNGQIQARNRVNVGYTGMSDPESSFA